MENHSCKGDCGSCGGCGAVLELTAAEIELLDRLAQYAFLPVFRRADDMIPQFLEDDAYTRAEYSIILQLLERKQLICVDYGQPLAPAPKEYPVAGSIGLTQRGQQVVEQLQLQGLQ